MTAISDEERRHLTEVVARRIGARSNADELAKLVSGYLDAVVRNAFTRTTDPGPVPTSLTAERSALLIEVSSQMGKVIEDYEIQALLRVPLSQARAMRTTLLATYPDIADDLVSQWAIRGAKRGSRQTIDDVNGYLIVFASDERRDAFVEQMNRAGTPVVVVQDDKLPASSVVVGDAFDSSKLPARRG